MNETLTHDQLEQLLPSAALEILEGDELVQVTIHVRECTGCAGLLASYREVVAGLGASLPEQPLPPARSAKLRARLLARTGTGPEPEPAAVTRRGPGPAYRWAGWAVAAGLVGILAVHHSIHRPVAYGWLAAGVLALVVIVLAGYVWIQHGRMTALNQRLTALQQDTGDSAAVGSGRPPSQPPTAVAVTCARR